MLGLPYLWNGAAYGGCHLHRGHRPVHRLRAPTYLRLRQGESFQRGPWHLGRWSYIMGWIAVTWVVIITILFMLPQVGPIGWSHVQLRAGRGGRRARLRLDLLGGVARKNWFTGPRVQGSAEELAAIEAELSA